MTYTKLVGLYARCSTEKQDLIAQKQQLLDYMEFYKKKNPDEEYMLKEYFDEGFSGANKKRPMLQQLLSDVRAKKVNVAVITKLDRLARTLTDLKYLVDEFKKYDCDLIITIDNIDTSTPQGQLFFHLYGAFIEFERSMVIERMQAGREYAEKYGSRSGKPCHRPKLEIDTKALLQYRDQGVSLNKMQKIFGVSRQTLKNRLQELI